MQYNLTKPPRVLTKLWTKAFQDRGIWKNADNKAFSPFFAILFQRKMSGQFSQINFLPNDKILDRTKSMVFVDEKIKVSKMIVFFYLDSVEKIAGNGENVGYQHFLLFPQCFQKAGSLKVGIVKGKGK